jgi:DNA-binding NarL/FixJ family response regulator
VRVLIVDASAGIRARIAARLKAASAEVVEAANGDEALEMAESAAPDVIVLDIHLDASTGIPALVRLDRASPGARIVVLTNEAGEIVRRECLRHGAEAFFDKSREFDRAIELILSIGVRPT